MRLTGHGAEVQAHQFCRDGLRRTIAPKASMSRIGTMKARQLRYQERHKHGVNAARATTAAGSSTPVETQSLKSHMQSVSQRLPGRDGVIPGILGQRRPVETPCEDSYALWCERDRRRTGYLCPLLHVSERGGRNDA